MLDEDYGDITAPTSGRDIKVTCTKQPGRMWATTDVRPRGSSTPLSSDQNKATEWMNNIPNLDDMFTCKTYEELEKIVSDWINCDDTSNDMGSTYGGGSSNSTASAQSTSCATDTTSTNDSNRTYKSLDDAFADLEDI